MISDLHPGLDFKPLHLGVAVPALPAATEMLATLFGYQVASGPFDDPIQRVSVIFLARTPHDPAEIELIAPLGDDSPVASMLKKTGGGAYHICMETPDLDRALQHLRENGCIILAEPVPAVAFQGRRIAWIYTPSRQLFELVEAKH